MSAAQVLSEEAAASGGIRSRWGVAEALFAPHAVAARAGIPVSMTVEPRVLMLMGALMCGCIGLALPLSILQIYDRIMRSGAVATLDALAMILLALFVLDFIVRNAMADLRSASAGRFANALTREAVSRLLHAPAGQVSEPPSKTEERLRGIGRLAGHLASTARQSAVEIPFALLYLTAVLIIGGAVVWVPLVLILVFGTITMVRGRRLRLALEERRRAGIAWSNHWQTVLQAISTVKSIGMERLMLRRSEPLRVEARALEERIADLGERSGATASALGSAIPLSVVSAGAILASDSGLTLGQVAACSLLSGRAVQPIIRLATVWNEHQMFRVTLDSVAELFRLPPACEPAEKPVEAPVIEAATSGRTPRIKLPPGGVLHVLGGTMEDRRVFAQVLSGQRAVSSPGIRLDGLTPRAYRQKYADAVAVIGREIAPFAGTVRDNLTGFGRRTKLDAALAMVEKLQIIDELNTIPHGLETRLDQRIDLAPNLVQGIALARILGADPVLIVLEDPIDAFDPMINIALGGILQEQRGHTTLVFIGEDLPPGLEADDCLYLGADGDASIRPIEDRR
ncbi:MAG: ABC transporter transmembrane domain-containing protein [Pseudomonadota bacterium]